MTTAYITHADCLRHEMGAGHPEAPDGFSAIDEHIRAAGLLEELRCMEAPLAGAGRSQAGARPRTKSSRFLRMRRRKGYLQLDPDTADESVQPGGGAARGRCEASWRSTK